MFTHQFHTLLVDMHDWKSMRRANQLLITFGLTYAGLTLHTALKILHLINLFRDGRLYSQNAHKPKINMDTPQRYTVWYSDMHIFIYIYIIIPVVPHKAVAEVSKIGNLLERLVVVNQGWQSEATDGAKCDWSLSLFLSLSLTIYLPTYLPIYLSNYLSIYLSLSLSLSLPLSLSFICPAVYLSICGAVSLSVM